MTPTASLAVRLSGAFLVGTLLAPVGLLALVGLAFGAWHIAAGAAALCVTVCTALLAAVHRGTGGGSSLRWGAGVTVAGTALAALCALAWQQSGGSFGRSQLGWAAAVGLAFVICAAATSPATRVAAGISVLVLLASSLAALAPALGDLLPEQQQRGCIASSHEEAMRRCG